MSQSNSIQVSNISTQTSVDELRDFFSFCGKVSDLSFTPPTKSATVTFEKKEAVKTALLLDNSQLGESQINVASASSNQYIAKDSLLTMAGTTVDDGTETMPIQQETGNAHNVPVTVPLYSDEQPKPFAQHEKPMRRILAEYLAHGYRIADKIIERGMEYDQRTGFTKAFREGLADFDKTFAEWEQKEHANKTMRELDEKHHLTRRAAETWNGAQSYFEKALGTRTGQKLRRFYEEKAKDVKDVHEEARHLANLKEGDELYHHRHHHLHRHGDTEVPATEDAGIEKLMQEENGMERGEEGKRGPAEMEAKKL